MPKQQQDKPEPFLPMGMKESFQWLVFLSDVYSICLLVFIRQGMGKRGVDHAGFFGWLFMLLYAGHMNSPEMLLYIKAWFVMVVYRKWRCDKNQPTAFQGWPMLTDWLIRNDRVARAVEPIVVYLIGHAIAAYWSESVGQFVAYGAFAMGIRCFIETAVIQRQKEAAHDQIILTQIMQERMEDAIRNHR